MSYRYDAFFSYKRDRESDEWHRRVKDKLLYWVRQELERNDVNIFFDHEEIHTGEQWRAKLADALLQSKCLVCLWSPLYFSSPWCVSEWLTFVEREEKCARSLIVPARFFDGESFPLRAKNTTTMDFSDFSSTLPRFWDTKKAVRFEREWLKPFACDLATLIRGAPPYDASFPIREATQSEVQGAGVIQRIADADD